MGAGDKKCVKITILRKMKTLKKISNLIETVLNIRININLQNLKILKFDRVR